MLASGADSSLVNRFGDTAASLAEHKKLMMTKRIMDTASGDYRAEGHP